MLRPYTYTFTADGADASYAMNSNDYPTIRTDRKGQFLWAGGSEFRADRPTGNPAKTDASKAFVRQTFTTTLSISAINVGAAYANNLQTTGSASGGDT